MLNGMETVNEPTILAIHIVHMFTEYLLMSGWTLMIVLEQVLRLCATAPIPASSKCLDIMFNKQA